MTDYAGNNSTKNGMVNIVAYWIYNTWNYALILTWQK